MKCYLRLGKLQNAHQKVLIFWIEIETDYVITRLKFLLQNHDLLAMFHSKTTQKISIRAKFRLRWRCLLFHLRTVPYDAADAIMEVITCFITASSNKYFIGREVLTFLS